MPLFYSVSTLVLNKKQFKSNTQRHRLIALRTANVLTRSIEGKQNFFAERTSPFKDRFALSIGAKESATISEHLPGFSSHKFTV